MARFCEPRYGKANMWQPFSIKGENIESWQSLLVGKQKWETPKYNAFHALNETLRYPRGDKKRIWDMMNHVAAGRPIETRNRSESGVLDVSDENKQLFRSSSWRIAARYFAVAMMKMMINKLKSTCDPFLKTNDRMMRKAKNRLGILGR